MSLIQNRTKCVTKNLAVSNEDLSSSVIQQVNKTQESDKISMEAHQQLPRKMSVETKYDTAVSAIALVAIKSNRN